MSQTTSACGSLCPSKLPFQNSPKLVALLQDSVNSGASVGFLPPLPVEAAEEYWLETLNEASQARTLPQSGSTVVVRYQVKDANGAYVSNLASFVSLTQDRPCLFF